MKLRNFVSPLALIAGLAAAAPGHAQTTTAADKTTRADSQGAEEVVVTGTRIVRPNLKSASPITSVNAVAIKEQGAVNIQEVLNRMGQVTPDSQEVYQNSNGKQKVKLRGLDFGRTLPLIDGQRLAGPEAVDLNIIPTALVDRIDVLTGGASSVYGSDAIAGVVNFVLKKHFEGVEMSANYGFYQHDNRSNVTTPVAQAAGIATPTGNVVDGARTDISVTAGHDFLDGKLNNSVFFDYRHGDPILFRDRDISGCQIQRVGATGLSCITTAQSPNGTLTPLGGTNPGVNVSDSTDGSRTFVSSSTIPGLGYSNSKDRESSRGYTRINLGDTFHLELSPSAELYGSALYMKDKSQNSFYGPYIQSYTAYGSTPYQVNCNNPLLSTSQAQTICGAAAGTSQKASLNIQYGFPGLGGNRSSDTFTNTQAHLSTGLRGTLMEGLKYDIGGVYTGNHDLWITDGKPVFSKIQNALNVVNVNGVATCQSVVDGTDPSCVPLDVFKANSGSAALNNYLFNERRAISDTQGRFYDFTANLTADLTRYGIRSPLADQGLAVSVGAEYRKNTQNIYVNDRYTDVYGTVSSYHQQDVTEANIEVQMPLVQNKPFAKLVQFNGGYRASKYSTNSNTFSTWKMEAVYSPISDITFRASINRAQRAPNVNEADQAVSYTTYPVQDPCASVNGAAPIASRAACKATGLADNLYGSSTLLCPDNACRERLNGNQINPEDAQTVTYGIVLTPRFIPRFSLSVDAYKIQVNDVIGYNYANFAVDGCVATASSYYCSRIVRNADGTLYGTSTNSGYIQAGVVNLYRLYAHGVDFNAQYSIPAPQIKGQVAFDFTGTLTTRSGGQNSVTTLAYNCVGYFGGSCSQPLPAWTHTLRTTYKTDNGKYTASLAWRFIGGTKAAQNSNDPALNSFSTTTVSNFQAINQYNYFDLAVSANIKGNVITASCNNIFDRMPPVMVNTYAYALSRGNTIPQRYDSLGRQFSLGVTRKF